MLLFHPSASALEGCAAHGADQADHRLRAHLRDCQRCRDEVQFLRDLSRRLTALDGPTTGPVAGDVLERRIMERVAAGERRLLPLNARPGRAHAIRARRALIAAAAAAILMVAWLAWPSTNVTASAVNGELRFGAPGIVHGRAMTVTYAAPSAFRDAARLVLRARYRGAEGEEYNHRARQVVAAMLHRGRDGRYHGTLTIPDSVVYAVFAVEDTAATHVDDNGRQLWHLMQRRADGEPSFAALDQRSNDLMGVNAESSFHAIRRLTELYPDLPLSWAWLQGRERFMLGRRYADSVRATHRERLFALHERYAARADLPLDVMWGLDSYAVNVSDGTSERVREIGRHWRARLKADTSTHVTTLMFRVFAVGDSSAAARTRVDSLRALAGYEALWPVAGHRVSFLANNAWVLAKVMHEPEAIVRWAERIVAASPDAAEFVFGGLLENPATRAAGMDRLRGAVRRLDAVDHLRRPLESTVAQQHRADRAQAGRLLARLGQALLEDGLVASGRDTLVLAARSLWDPAVSTRLVHAFRQQGDTLAAARQLARIIVDPAAPAALRDSLARLEPGVDGVRWNRLVAEARQEMRAWVLEDAVMRTLPRVDAIITSGGAAQSLDHARRGRPAVVTFWSRFCGPSRQQMAELPRLAERLRAHGVELIAITTEEPSAELAKFLAESKVTIPVHHDRTRQAGRAFGQYATPEYHVVDADGRLRFTRSSLDQVVRQASVLVP